MTRQQRRAELRKQRWYHFADPPSGRGAMSDDKGIIPRRVRRDMAGFKRRRK